MLSVKVRVYLMQYNVVFSTAMILINGKSQIKEPVAVKHLSVWFRCTVAVVSFST